jgi:predicted ester cyclase
VSRTGSTTAATSGESTLAQTRNRCLDDSAYGIVSGVDPEANKRLVRRFYEEVWARGNVEFAEQVFADDYVRHDLRPTQAAPGPLGHAQIARAFREAFPDLQWRIDLLLAEGDLVAARWTASGTHNGPWAGVAPTLRRAEFSGVNIFRFVLTGRSLRSGTIATTSA